MTPQTTDPACGGRLPDPYRIVHAAAGRHRAVGMVRHDPDRVVVPAEDADLPGAGSPVGQAIHDGDRRDPRHARWERGGGGGEPPTRWRAVRPLAFPLEKIRVSF